MFLSFAETRELDCYPICTRYLWSTSTAPWPNTFVIIDSLTYVRVKPAARPRQNCIRQSGQHSPDRRQVGGHHAFLLRTIRIPEVSDPTAGGAQAIFECGESIVIQVGAATIDLLRARRLTLFDQPPEQKRHGAEMIEFCVGAAVFVHHDAAVAQR